ncbi:carboxypeptidase N subunit 2-like [Bradysia coprophila]|uniref:carboxypeptidase N subunit 2-like n=1 Tax=Bradysia coprophila TaxID=38358 RepID=UPI00187DD8A5|nr:carboxypeptidase N subunit 2-like [Bradysia coprophila]
MARSLIKTFIIFVSVLHFTSCQQMDCTYSVGTSNKYQCSLNVNNPNGLDGSVSIAGHHLGSYADGSVGIVKIISGITKNIPSQICKQFPNIELIHFTIANIEIVSTIKCSLATELDLSRNSITGVSMDICQYQPLLTKIDLSYNQIKSISSTALKSCKNLVTFYIQYNKITEMASTLFTYAPKLRTLNINGNPITSIPEGLFGSELTTLDMAALQITDLPLNVFPATNKLTALGLGSNDFTQYRTQWFQNLKSLSQLWLNWIHAPIPANLFKSLPSLSYLMMINCNITTVNREWFSTLSRLYLVTMERNNIADIPDGTFISSELSFVDVSHNKLKTVRSKWFSNAAMTSLRDLDVESNEINSMDSLFFDTAKNLNAFSATKNKCYNGSNIIDFRDNRSSYMAGFKTCINNF